jgi:hypothetical protein
MSDEHPIPRMMLMMSNVLGKMEEADSKIPPLEEQQALSEGDLAVIAFGSSPMEHDLVVAQLLNPEEYKTTYPDYETRLLKDRALCRWQSIQDRAGDIGWFARAKLIPMNQEQYDLMLAWFDQDDHKQVPDWLDALYSSYTMKIHEQAPDKVPSVVQCTKCEGMNTELHTRELIKHKGRAGLLERDGKKQYHMISDPQHKSEKTVHIHCKDCGHRDHIDPTEIPDF